MIECVSKKYRRLFNNRAKALHFILRPRVFKSDQNQVKYNILNLDTQIFASQILAILTLNVKV